MIKTQEVPPELQKLNKLFMQVTNQGYKHDLHTTYSDWIDMLIAIFSQDTKVLEELQRRYTEAEQELLYAIMQEWLDILNQYQGGKVNPKFTDMQASDDSFIWYDALGAYYEILASMGKRQAFGQFFTPQHVCDMMAHIVVNLEEETDKLPTVSDPCCGSARMLLAAHCRLKGKAICYAEDMDPVCCKMAVLNMFVHGLCGEVVHHNSLDPASFYAGWHVNPHLRYSGMASIKKLEDRHQSHIYMRWNRILQEKGIEEYKKQAEVRRPIVEAAPHYKVEQLSLFDA